MAAKKKQAKKKVAKKKTAKKKTARKKRKKVSTQDRLARLEKLVAEIHAAVVEPDDDDGPGGTGPRCN